MNDLLTRSALKRNVKDLFKGNWITAIKVNIVQIVINFFVGITISGAIIGTSLIASRRHFMYTTNDRYYGHSGFGGGNSAMSFVFQALLTFIIVGAQFGLLDWLHDHTKAPEFKTSFQIFTRNKFIPALAMYLFQWIFIFGWTLLFVIPGIIKRFSYSQTYFLYKAASDRGISDQFEYYDYVTFSRRLMDGNKGRLFVLNLSLIGWLALSVVSLGIGFIWFVPYQNAIYSEFFKDLAEKQGSQKVPEIFGEVETD